MLWTWNQSAFSRPAFATGFSRWEGSDPSTASRLQPGFSTRLQTAAARHKGKPAASKFRAPPTTLVG